MEYFIGISGVQSGPFSETEIREKIVRNAYPAGALCWAEGWPQWRTLESVFTSHGSTPPPVPTNQPPVLRPFYGDTPADNTPPTTSGLAIASLILGVLSFFTFFVTSIPAIVCGHVACSEIKKSGGRKKGRGMAIAGLVMGYMLVAVVPVGLIAAMAIPAFQKVRSASQEKVVLNNLRQLDAAGQQFMLETNGPRATYTDLVGPSLYIKTLVTVAGEDYTDIVIHKDDRQIKVTLQDGRVIALDRYYTSDNSTFSK